MNSITALVSVWIYAGLIFPAFSLNARSSPPPIIACKSTAEVQKAIDIYIKPNDVVLELGAQLSDTSAHLCRAVGDNGKAVLVDVERKAATSGRSIGRDVSQFLENESVHEKAAHEKSTTTNQESFVDRVDYHELEQFDHWRHLLNGDYEYDLLILDVGSTIGNDLYLSALSIANEFIANQQQNNKNKSTRAIIVKSKVLNNIARRMIHSQRLLDGTVTLPTKEELVGNPDPLLIPCVGVRDYRKTIPFVVEKGDEVIEVGSHYGTSTALLHEAVMNGENRGFCAGVDIGEKIIKNARKRYPDMIFEVVDAWNTLELLKLKANRADSSSSSLAYDVVYADIGGLSGAHGLLESLALLDAIGKALEPRCIVIKSLCMKRLASQLIPLSKVNQRITSK